MAELGLSHCGEQGPFLVVVYGLLIAGLLLLQSTGSGVQAQ